jgi:hypothetical protein
MRLPSMRLLCLLTLVSATYLAAAPAKSAPSKSQQKMAWRLQLSIPTKPDFGIAVQQIGSDFRPFGILPLENASISALKVVAQEQKTDILVNLYAVKDYRKGLKCQELKALTIESLGTFLVPKNKPVEIASLSPVGVGSLHMAAYEEIAPDPSGGCCTCAGISCCPTKGHCFDDCNGCGQCCSS